MFELMLSRKTNFTIARMVRLLEVFGSGYYVWLDHADVYPVDAVKPQNVIYACEVSDRPQRTLGERQRERERDNRQGE